MTTRENIRGATLRGRSLASRPADLIERKRK